MQGLLERLQRRDDAELNTLLEQADLYLVPNMNPDGAFRGHLRTNVAGCDLNRAWQSASETNSPEVYFVQQQMRTVGVDLFLDIHGDEEIPHVFVAGCEGNPGYSSRLQRLENQFKQLLIDNGAEFQTTFGYTPTALQARPTPAWPATQWAWSLIAWPLPSKCPSRTTTTAPTRTPAGAVSALRNWVKTCSAF